MRRHLILVTAVLLMFGSAVAVSAGTEPAGSPAIYFEGPCTASWTCPAGACQPQVSCTGNTTCSAAADYVICDDKRTDCVMPELSCLTGCMDAYFECTIWCTPMPDPPPDPCGCLAARELCREGCCL